MRDGVRLAVGTLTRWPVAPPAAVDGRTARTAMLAAPGVGLVLGTSVSALAWVAGAGGLSPLVTAALVVAVLAYASRGLHLDGLADLADGLGSGREPSGALEVMRRGDVGPIGAATVALTLLVQVAALESVLVQAGPLALAGIVAASRLALPMACLRGIPPARTGGLGAAVAGTVTLPALALDVVLTGALILAVLGVTGAPATSGVLVVLAVATVAVAGTAVARRRLGGITGDVLGALVELALAAALVAAAVRI